MKEGLFSCAEQHSEAMINERRQIITEKGLMKINKRAEEICDTGHFAFQIRYNLHVLLRRLMICLAGKYFCILFFNVI